MTAIKFAMESCKSFTVISLASSNSPKSTSNSVQVIQYSEQRDMLNHKNASITIPSEKKS